jgi:hypothetical protein
MKIKPTSGTVSCETSHTMHEKSYMMRGKFSADMTCSSSFVGEVAKTWTCVFASSPIEGEA